MEKTLFRNLFQLIFRYRSRILLGCLYLLISNILLVATPFVFRQAVMQIDARQPASPWLWTLLLLALTFLAGYFKYWNRVQFMDVSRFAEEEIRNRLFERIQQQTRAFFDRHATGDLLSILTNDIAAYQEVLGPGLMFPIYFLTLTIPAFVALFFLSLPMAWFASLPLLLLPLVMLCFRGYTFGMTHRLQETLGHLSTYVHEIFSGIRLVKGYAIEESIQGSFQEKSETLSHWSLVYYTFQGFVFPFLSLIARLVTVGLVFVAGWLTLRQSGLSPADYLSFMWIQSYLFFPLLMLGWVIPIYERGRAAYQRLLTLYEEPIEVKGAMHSSLKIPNDAAICIDQLTFTYPLGDFPALKNITAKIPGRQFVGITGPVGAGKSTLFKLLTREYEIPRGMIALGDRDIHDFPLEAFSQTMVTVEQVPFLFSRTIAENVQFGLPDARDEEMIHVSKEVDLHNTVMGFPQQYQTLVGERGVTLSGGQKQRIAMARAFLLNRSILLLDDIFSSVDFATEQHIFARMRQNFQGRTVLLITQRVTILEQLDWLLYFDDGHLIEEGTPTDLQKKGGRYAALADLMHE